MNSAEPTAATLLTSLAAAIDSQNWDAMSGLLDPTASIRLAHTEESFDAEHYLALNRDYPGVWRFTSEEVVDAGDAAVMLALVTGDLDDARETHRVAVFGQARDGLLIRITELWAEVVAADPTRRPTEP